MNKVDLDIVLEAISKNTISVDVETYKLFEKQKMQFFVGLHSIARMNPVVVKVVREVERMFLGTVSGWLLPENYVSEQYVNMKECMIVVDQAYLNMQKLIDDENIKNSLRRIHDKIIREIYEPLGLSLQ